MTREYAIVFGVVDLLTAATQIAGQAPVAGYTASQVDVAFLTIDH